MGRTHQAPRADPAIEPITTILKGEFSETALDRRPLDLYQAYPMLPIDVMAERLTSIRHAVSGTLVRLLSHDLIEVARSRIAHVPSTSRLFRARLVWTNHRAAARID